MVFNTENIEWKESENGERRNCDHGDVQKYMMAENVQGNADEDEMGNRGNMYSSIEALHVARKCVEQPCKGPQ